MRGEKHIAPTDFIEHLEKSYVSENRKVYYGPFLQNGLHEKYCCISESRWKAQHLEKSTIHSLLLKRWRWNWPIKNFAGVWSSISIVYYVSALLISSFIFLSQFLITFFIKFLLSLQYDQHITFWTLTFEIHALLKRTTFIRDV